MTRPYIKFCMVKEVKMQHWGLKVRPQTQFHTVLTSVPIKDGDGVFLDGDGVFLSMEYF